jgi:hypothetical protein
MGAIGTNPGEIRGDVQEIFGKFKANRRLREANEAETRVELIDEILRTLGWQNVATDRELPTATGRYLDYSLRVGRDPWLVVEAKRSGDTFDLSLRSKQKHTRIRSVHTLLSQGGTNVRDVMEQAAGYCNATGTAFACVTNGYQWVFLRGLSTPARAWPKGSAVVFQSPEEVLENFDEFFGCLGREYATTAFLPRLLDRPGTEAPPPPTIPRDFFKGSRPSIDPERLGYHRAIGELLFTDLWGDGRTEMLRRCYVQPGVSAEFERDLHRLLKDSARQLEDEDSFLEGDTSRFVSEVSRREIIGVQDPVLVVGHVGAGKTTFLHRVLAEFREDHDAFCALVDLEGRGQPFDNDAAAEERFVCQQILKKVSTAAQTVLKHHGHPAGELEEADPDSINTLRTVHREILNKERKIGQAVWEADTAAWPRKEYELIQELRSDIANWLTSYLKHFALPLSATRRDRGAKEVSHTDRFGQR